MLPPATADKPRASTPHVTATSGETILASGGQRRSTASLCEGVTPEGLQRLVRAACDTLPNSLTVKADASYARWCQQLVSEVPAMQGAVVLDGGMAAPPLLLVPQGEATSPRKVYFISDDSVQVLPDAPLTGGRWIVLALPVMGTDSLPSYTVLFDDSGKVLVVNTSAAETAIKPLVRWLHQRGAAHALVRRKALLTAGSVLRREIGLLAPLPVKKATDAKEPVGGAVELCISDDIGGVFIKGWLRDPHTLVASLALEWAADDLRVLEQQMYWWSAPELERKYKDAPGSIRHFIAWIPQGDGAPPSLQPPLQLCLHSGAVVKLVPPVHTGTLKEKRAAILSSLSADALNAEALDKVLTPPVTALQQKLTQPAVSMPVTAPDVHSFGRQSTTPPQWTVLIPLYKNLDYLRFQLAAFALDRDFADAEILYVLDSPEQKGALLHYLRGLMGVYTPLSVRVLVMPTNGGYSAANNAGSRLAQGSLLALVNSDVVPCAPGWLSAMTASLNQAANGSAIGARLLFEDGALQHAGMYFARDAGGYWLNVHYYKGAPGNWPPALAGRSVPAVTGACILLAKDTYERVGGFADDYVIGDYEDTDLCLKLRAHSGDIVYCPQAVLYHFERKSISRHQGYQETVAGLYNRRLAELRWGNAMQQVMESAGASAPQRFM